LEKHAELRVLERDVQLTLIPNVNFIILDHKLVLVDEQYWTQTVWHQGQVEAFSELFSDLWQKASSKRRALTLIQKARKHFLS